MDGSGGAGFEPDYRVHPGEHLAEYLEVLGSDADGLASSAGLDPPEVVALVGGWASVTARTADGLGAALGTEPSLWTGLQRLWDMHPLTVAEVRGRG